MGNFFQEKKLSWGGGKGVWQETYFSPIFVGTLPSECAPNCVWAKKGNLGDMRLGRTVWGTTGVGRKQIIPGAGCSLHFSKPDNPVFSTGGELAAFLHLQVDAPASWNTCSAWSWCIFLRPPALLPTWCVNLQIQWNTLSHATVKITPAYSSGALSVSFSLATRNHLTIVQVSFSGGYKYGNGGRW